MECVLQCGFDKIVNSNGEIRESVWKKGHSLYESKHVFDLKEVTSESECLITAFVIPETSVSSKYKVEIKVCENFNTFYKSFIIFRQPTRSAIQIRLPTHNIHVLSKK